MKNLKKILTLCVTICVLIAASACFKTHPYGTEWEKDETNHWHSCSDEGCEEVSDKEAHTYGDGEVTTPATEEADGVMTYKCTVCGYEKTAAIEKLAHTHNLSKVNENKAGCLTDGTKAYYICDGCDLIFADADGKTVIDAPDVIHATDHDWAAATCDAPKTCDNCGATEGEKLTHVEAAPIEENRVEATCGKDGSYDSVVKCSLCGDELSREAKVISATGNHVYATETERVPATCDTDGYVVKQCKCGKTETTALTAPGHTYDNDEDMICNIDGCGYDRSCKHTNTKVLPAVNATCTSAGLTEGKQCVDCDEIIVSQEKIDMLPHTSAEAVEENRVEATCLVDGSYDSVVYCSVCKTYEISRTKEVITAVGSHTYDDDSDATCNKCDYVRVIACQHTNTNVLPAVNATCTSTGLTEGKQCTDCDEILVKQEVTNVVDHTPADAVKENEKSATCVSDGSYESVVYCSVCKTYEISRTTETITASGHSYDNEFDAECNNGCGTTRNIPHAITVTGGTADKEYAMVGDTVTLTANDAAENTAFSHWTLNGERIEGGSFEMPDGEATVVAVFVDTVRTLATPDNSESELIYRLSNGEIQIDRASASMFGKGVDHVEIYVYDSADATESVGKFIMYVTPGAVNAGGAVGYVQTMDGSITQNIVFGANHNYWITNANAGNFFTVLNAAVGYEYSTGNTYYFAVKSIAYADPVDENGIAITYLDSELSVIGSTGIVQTPGAASGVYTLKVDGGLIENKYTELKVGCGNTVSVTTEAKDGWLFGGWYLTDENGEATGEALSVSLTYSYKVTADATLKAVFTQETTPLATPDNSESKLIFKEDGGSIALDRSGTNMFADGVAYILYYVYDSADADKGDYIAQFKLNGYAGTTTSSIVTSFETMDGVVYNYVRGGDGNYYIFAGEVGYFYNMLSELIGYDYSYGQTYYFAAQAIAMEGTAYTDSEISEIGKVGFARDASKGTDKYTITVENGLIDGEHTTITAGYGVTVNIKANKFENDEFGVWKYVTYGEDGEEILGSIASELEEFTLTVTSSITIRPIAKSELGERIKLAAPDNSNNQMIKFNGAIIEYDRQKTESGARDTAFDEGVAYVRYWIFLSNDDDAEAVAYFDLRSDGYLFDKNGTSIPAGKMLGEPGNYYSENGNWHNFIKEAYQLCTGSAWNNSDTHYFACQSITDNPDIYENSEIGTKGSAWTSI